MKKFLYVIISLIALVGTAYGEEYITIFSPTGTLLRTFPVGLQTNQYISFVEVDGSGNIWVGKIDSGHGTNVFNPNDVVDKFSPMGAFLQTVKGPTRMQLSIGFDSSGFLYIGAIPDGGLLGDDRIYKFQPNGIAVTSFGSNPTEWTDIAITSDDRVFATRHNACYIFEYNTSGGYVNSTASFDGASRFGQFIALNNSGDRLWSYQPSNGPGVNFVVSYDLALTVQSSFGLSGIGNPSLSGLEVMPSGNLLLLGQDNVFYEFQTNGTLVNSFTLEGDPTRFALDPSGNLVVANKNNLQPLQPTTAIPTINQWGIILFMILAGLGAVYYLRRQRRAEN